MWIQSLDMRRIAVLVFGIVMGLVFTLGDALAASPEVSVTESVTASFQGEIQVGEEAYYYEIWVFAGPGEEGEPGPLPVNGSVDFQLFSHEGAEDPFFSCTSREDTLNPASIHINKGLAAASLEGVYPGSSPEGNCGDVTFDLDWTGDGKLVSETSHNGDEGEICHTIQAHRDASAEGTVQFSSGPITTPIHVATSQATIQVEQATLCVMPGAPEPDSE